MHFLLRSVAGSFFSSFSPNFPEATCASSFQPFLAAATDFSSTVIGADEVTYPTLKHLLRSGLDFLLHIFNLSWSLHSFPFILKISSIIPIHKLGSLPTPASFLPICLTFCVSKLFKHNILFRLLFFSRIELHSPSRQAGFRPGRSTRSSVPYSVHFKWV